MVGTQPQKVAFNWIVDILRERRVPFQITGGLAARHYGATRPLADIDIDIPGTYFDAVLPKVRSHIIFGPSRYRDRHWNVRLITLRRAGQLIDIADSTDCRIFDAVRRRWSASKTDYEDTPTGTIFGKRVPIISKERLIRYKSKLRRPVDRADLEELRKR